MLSLRGMGVTIGCLKPLLERLREAYKANLKKGELHDEQVAEELAAMKKRYYRGEPPKNDADNLALMKLIQHHTRFPKPKPSSTIKKLALQSLDLANNDIRLVAGIKKKFTEAVGYSDLQRLDISDNNLGNEGIGVVASALQIGGSQLRWLSVANCGFTIEGGSSFLSQLGKNKSIEHAIIDKNNL